MFDVGSVQGQAVSAASHCKMAMLSLNTQAH